MQEDLLEGVSDRTSDTRIEIRASVCEPALPPRFREEIRGYVAREKEPDDALKITKIARVF